MGTGPADEAAPCTHRGSEQLLGAGHTPSTAFRHLPPNSARIGYATEGALFISAQTETDRETQRETETETDRERQRHTERQR